MVHYDVVPSRREIIQTLFFPKLSLVFGQKVDQLALVQFYFILLEGLYCGDKEGPNFSESEILIGSIISDLFTYLESMNPRPSVDTQIKAFITEPTLVADALSLFILENNRDETSQLEIANITNRITSAYLSLPIPPVVDLFTTTQFELHFHT